MSSGFEIQLIAIIISIACALPGVFLVLRKMAMMTDSITHTILLGIVLAFFITYDLSSPFLIVGAALMGVVTVWLTEMIATTKLVSGDSAIGIVFPLLFSVAIILITKYAGSTHLCVDSVLLGELAFAPFDRMVVFGVDIGAKSIYSGLLMLLINFGFIFFLFKELKIATFDPVLAGVMGLSPILIHYGLMTMVSLTTVVSFEAVGSILVIAFMIGPPVTAYLLTDDLKKLIMLSALFGALSGILGYQLAYLFDVSIAGSMAVMTGVIFICAFVFAPKRGLISVLSQKHIRQKNFAETTLLVHLHNHKNSEDAFDENGVETICNHLYWERKKVDKMVNALLHEGKIEIQNQVIILTPFGETSVKEQVKALLTIE